MSWDQMPTYHPELPPGCPPNDAETMTGTIYRRVPRHPHVITNADFYSSKEKHDPKTDRLCQRWGTSIWIDIAHLKHDLNAVAYLRNYRFVAVNIEPRHGVIKKTHSDTFVEHRTFWRDCTIDFGPLCEVIYCPLD
jgi:hypothetical protein